MNIVKKSYIISMEYGICEICGTGFVKMRSNKKCCSSQCSVKASYLKSRKTKSIRNYIPKVKKEFKNKEVYDIVEEFVLDIQSKRFYADSIDIWKLISIYDLVYPKKITIPSANDIEKSAMIMFYQICIWYRTEKDKIEIGVYI